MLGQATKQQPPIWQSKHEDLRKKSSQNRYGSWFHQALSGFSINSRCPLQPFDGLLYTIPCNTGHKTKSKGTQMNIKRIYALVGAFTLTIPCVLFTSMPADAAHTVSGNGCKTILIAKDGAVGQPVRYGITNCDAITGASTVQGFVDCSGASDQGTGWLTSYQSGATKSCMFGARGVYQTAR